MFYGPGTIAAAEGMSDENRTSSIGFGALAAPALIRVIATNAERLNFATIWAPEHVVLFDRYTSRYPYSTDGSGAFLAHTRERRFSYSHHESTLPESKLVPDQNQPLHSNRDRKSTRLNSSHGY